jgi:lipid-binding SYLF domain-containing protein
MHIKTIMKTFTILTLVMVMTIGVVSAATVEERRQSIRSDKNETLQKVYNAQPRAKNVIANAAGYAAFTITDAKLVFFGGGGGKGMTVNNRTQQETFMGADALQVGFGLGVKRYDVVFVFGTEKALLDFANNGWKVDGQATLAATDSINGDSLAGAVSVGPDIWMYQLTDKGLEASITVRGIHYFKVKELN